ncbi:hypothetical protein DEI93_05225 [Curtobacterium sp. MCBD17_035]|uniref:hypothetical protein n=1 Tax=Curtobacterium sp. MCBD17_035 TaxID=2175673 RepID=UPI000DA828D7|nr:hypothetical protein [Curtobacterium sp. MCBD17_035]WIB68438.1 hypothetical protein DEI93_05225 [Curtobacterium sp. MCBD17_035]
MSLARHAIAVSVVTALVLAALFAIALTQPDRLDTAHLSGDVCAGWAARNGPRSMTVTIPVRNDSSVPVRVMGMRAGEQTGAGKVRFRVISGKRLSLNTFGPLRSFRRQGHVQDAVAANLPARSWSTVLVSMTVAQHARSVAIGDVQVSYRGRLGTVRTEHLDTPLGVQAPRTNACDLSGVSS